MMGSYVVSRRFHDRAMPRLALSGDSRSVGVWLLIVLASCGTTAGQAPPGRDPTQPAPQLVFDRPDGGVELGSMKVLRCETAKGNLRLHVHATHHPLCPSIASELRLIVKVQASHENGTDTVLFDSSQHPEWKPPVVSEGPPPTMLSVPLTWPQELTPVLLIEVSGLCAGGQDRAQGRGTCLL